MKTTLNDIHFEVLGVTRYSTKYEIKKAYREQIKMWHPDKFPNQPDKILEALERSKIINEAFAFLENYQAPTKSYTTSNTSTYYRPKQKSTYRQENPKARATRVNIERIRVKSSNIYSVGYDKTEKILQVEFLNGSIYQYCDVPEYVFNELLQASSKGKYFNSKIAFCYKYEYI